MDSIKVTLPKFLIPYEAPDLIRLGNKNDGGYLVKESILNKSNLLLSMGILYDWKFEKEIYKNYGFSIVTYDGSVGSKYFRKKIKTRIRNSFSNLNFAYIKRTLFYIFLPIRFFYFFSNSLSKNKIVHYEKFVTNSKSNIDESNFLLKMGYKPSFISIDEIIEKHISNEKNIILKIDIEENEYDLLDSILDIQNNLSMLIIEFHNLNTENLNKLENFISKFNLNLFHTHANNFGWRQNEQIKMVNEKNIPLVLELTFANEKPISGRVAYLPHKLDNECNTKGQTLNIELNK